MKSTVLNSDTNIQRDHSTRKPDGCQQEKNNKTGIATFPADSPLVKWPAEQKKNTAGLPTGPDDANLKEGTDADKMNIVSSFKLAESPITLPETDGVIGRIKQLEERYKLNHTELAKEIGISRSSVHATLKGRTPTQKLIKKLVAAEKRLEASTLQTQIQSQTMLVFAMKSLIPDDVATGPNQAFARPKGVDGNTYPEGTIINLTQPPLIKGIEAIVRAHTDGRYNDLIKCCLPKELANNEWIENLSPTSYLGLLRKAVILILGPAWKIEFARLVTETEAQSKRPAIPEQKQQGWPVFRPDPNIQPFPSTTMPEGL